MVAVVARISVLLALLLIVFFANVFSGAVSIPWHEFSWNLQETNSTAFVLMEWRLAHALGALFVGGGLALTGSVLQRVLRNPLADPFVLGVTSGSTFFAVLSIALGSSAGFLGFSMRTLWALVGAILSLALVTAAKRMLFRGEDSYGVPLAGMLLNAFFGAMLTFVLTMVNPERLTESFRWLVGDIQHLALLDAGVVGLVVLLGSAVLIRMAPAIGALAFGDDFAFALGFPAKRLRQTVVIICAVIIAVVVSVAGSVGFVGLVVPHIARWLVRGELAADWLASAVLGATLLLLADIFSRVAMAPAVLPVGIFTALIGVPLLVVLAVRSGESYGERA